MRLAKLLCLLALLLPTSAALAQTGKIAGQVTDAATGDPLPGVAVTIEGTTQGNITDLDGYYTILNVRPGTYSVQASFVGYTSQIQSDVAVRIDLTTTVDFQLQEATVGLGEVVVQAERPVVQRDLSASRVDVTAEQIENLPVTDVASVVGMQAGVQGLNIRGDAANLSKIMVDGMDMSTRRNNDPYTAVSYAAVEEIQVQSGGFSAKYGDMRAGIINVITREGDRNRYSGSVIARYAPPAQKYFGVNVADPNSFWMRPFLDPAVSMVGTENGTWDEYTKKQYDTWDGFNDYAEDHPDEGLTPEQWQEVFLYQHRRDLEISKPDYVVDGAFGGPVPLVSKALGDLRFYASYRQQDTQYIIPLTSDGYGETNGRLKLTSDIGRGMKLMVEGMIGSQEGTATINRNGPLNFYNDGDRENTFGTDGQASYNRPEDWMFAWGALTTGRIEHNLIGGTFTHTLSPKTFYEVKLQRLASTYRTTVPRERDEVTKVFCVEGTEYCLNEQPFGFSHQSASDPVPGDMRMGAHWSEFRDTSDVADWSGRFDITSQVNRTNMVQAGFEFSATPQHTNWGTPDDLLTGDDVYSRWDATELYGAAYLQDKLEFKGMVANVGLRLDYMDPNTDWYDYTDPYSEAFTGVNAEVIDSLLPKKRVSPQVFLSPRLGLSFPITESSKLYFNYGHQRQRSVPTYLYQIRRDFITNSVVQLPNPNAPMELNIAYELGYEQSLFDQFLVRIAGYYRDIRDQMRQITYRNTTGLVNYTINQPDNYADTRGIEVSVFKNTGWIRGFANYSYMVRSRGDFGYGQQLENRQDQRNYERGATFTQAKPVPQPYARFNLEFVAPRTFGPAAGGLYPLGDWRISFLGEWQAGPTFTWVGTRQSERGVQDNMRWKGYRMVDMRIGKNFNVGRTNAQLFADITNVFNIKNLNVGSFRNGDDRDRYLTSLKLPKEFVEGWEHNYTWKDEEGNPIYGNDKPGDIDADYIDKPDLTSLWYLFPRTVNLGVKLSF